jgi:hypothetical protein
MIDPLFDDLRSLRPGQKLQVGNGERSYVVRYDEDPAYADSGHRVPGHYTGDYEVCSGTWDDLLGQRVATTVHVGPDTGNSPHGWAAERVARFLSDRLAPGIGGRRTLNITLVLAPGEATARVGGS